MNPDTNTKRTKRLRDDDHAVTLEEHIARRRKMFVTAREEIPKLHKQAAEKRKAAEILTKRFQTRQRLDLLEEASDIAREADIRASMTREHEFEKNAEVGVSKKENKTRNNK